MSIIKYIDCDGDGCRYIDCYGDGCRGTYQLCPPHKQIHQLRHHLEILGWRCGLPGGRDLCPGCWDGQPAAAADKEG